MTKITIPARKVLASIPVSELKGLVSTLYAETIDFLEGTSPLSGHEWAIWCPYCWETHGLLHRCGHADREDFKFVNPMSEFAVIDTRRVYGCEHCRGVWELTSKLDVSWNRHPEFS